MASGLDRLKRFAFFFFTLGVAVLLLRIMSAEGSVYRGTLRWEQDAPAMGIKQTEPYLTATTLVDGYYEKMRVVGFVRLIDFALSNNMELSMPLRADFLDLNGDAFTRSGRMRTHLIIPRDHQDKRPLNSKIKIEEVDPETVAYIRFNGSYSVDKFLKEYNRLLNWADSEGYSPIGPPRQFYFDHPFWKLPWFLRCEIQLPIERVS